MILHARPGQMYVIYTSSDKKFIESCHGFQMCRGETIVLSADLYIISDTKYHRKKFSKKALAGFLEWIKLITILKFGPQPYPVPMRKKDQSVAFMLFYSSRTAFRLTPHVVKILIAGVARRNSMTE